jgi:hypothetical protein
MNDRARRVIDQQVAQLTVAIRGTQSLPDNPDDFNLTVQEEQQLRNAIAMIQAARDELRKIMNN